MRTKSEGAGPIRHKGPANVDELANKGAGDDGDAGKIHTELDRIGVKLAEVQSVVKSAPSASEVAKLAADIATIQQSLGDAKGNYSGLIKTLEARVDELATTAALGTSKAAAPEGIRAMAQQVLESDGYKSLWDASGRPQRREGFTAPIKIQSISAAKSATPVIISDVVGGSPTEVYRSGIVADPGFPATIRSRIPTVIVKGATKYVIPTETEASRYGAVHSLLTTAIDGDPTPKNTAVVADIEGFMVGATVKFYHGTTGALLGEAVLVSKVTKTLTFAADTLDFDAAIGTRVVSENFESTAEQGTKQSGHVGLTNTEYTFQTLAQLIPTTVNALNTVAGLRTFIESKLPLRYERNLSRHLQYGTGTAPQLAGFRAKSGAQSYLWSAGEVGDNRVDALIRAAYMVPWNSSIGIVMNQADLQYMETAKTTDGHYLATGAFGAYPLTGVGAQRFLGPYELVFDYACAAGDFSVINWQESSEFVDQDTAELAWGYINDDFSVNIIRARYEATVLHAIFGTWGYVVGTWDSEPSAV